MNTIEILSKLEKIKFTTEQARTITEIFKEHRNELATKEDVKTIRKDINIIVVAEVSKAKYDLVKWIVGGFITNGVIATLLKYFG